MYVVRILQKKVIIFPQRQDLHIVHNLIFVFKELYYFTIYNLTPWYRVFIQKFPVVKK